MTIDGTKVSLPGATWVNEPAEASFDAEQAPAT